MVVFVLRGAVFDFDGVIVDSHPAHMRAWKTFLSSVGKIVSEEQLQFVMDGRKRDDILRHFMGDLDADQIVQYGLRKEQYFRDEVTHVRPAEGLLGFLEDLQSEQLALAIASSGSKSRIHFLLDLFDLRKYFREVVTGDEVEEGKPHPAVFLKAARRLGLDPSELMAFEDAVSGIYAAKSAGMTCIGIARLDRASILFAAGANDVVSDFRCLSCSKLRELLSNRAGTNSTPGLH
jgi:HAD superfamily hydrolase (TIGR01509 family)